MTCIVAVKDKESVYFGCDSMSSTDNLKKSLTKNSMKLIKHNNIVYGSTGYTAQSNWLRLSPELASLKYKGEEPIGFATNMIAPLVEHATTKVQITKDQRKEFWGTVLVGFGAHLFQIGCFFGTIEIDQYASCGSGEELALGALYATEGQPVKDRVAIALKAAANHCLTVGGPFYYKST